MIAKTSGRKRVKRAPRSSAISKKHPVRIPYKKITPDFNFGGET